MAFWICLDIFLVLLTLSGLTVNKRRKKKILIKFIYLILFFVSAFRYNLATDYSAYVDMFYEVSINDNKIYPEYSYKLFSEILRNLSFDYQSIFVIYTIICIYFLYKAAKYWSNANENIELIVVCFFALGFIDGFWESMNTIRQTAAALVILYGSRFLYEKKHFKFLCYVTLSVFFHYSAIICISMLLLPLKIKNKKILVTLCASSFFIKYLGIEQALYFIFSIIGRGTSYINLAATTGSGIGIVYIISLFVFSSIFLDYRDSKNVFCNTMFLYGVIVKFVFINFDVIGRFSQYFFSFYFLSIPMVLLNFLHSRKVKIIPIIFLLACIPVHLYMLYHESISDTRKVDVRTSAGNIDYKMNFNILK